MPNGLISANPFAASNSTEQRLGFEKPTKQRGDERGKKKNKKKTPTLVHSLSDSFLSAESGLQKSTFPARMRFENVRLAACNSSVGFGRASVGSPVGGVAIDVAEITHVSQVYLGSARDEWRGKLLLAGTKVGRTENTRSEIC